MHGEMAFRFLNEERVIGAGGWDDPKLAKLWRYNLHYFDDLNAWDAPGRLRWHQTYLARWLAANPPASGSAWEPYPTSLRIVNWVKWAMASSPLPDGCAHSLAIQARHLARRLEIHLLGNHLFANAKALVFAGRYFQGPEAERWTAIGLRILAREIPEQILADGGQFERSPMYHALALEDMLDLINLMIATGGVVPEAWRAHVHRMLGWLNAMSHPDGEIAQFNDAAIGIAPSPAELERYANALGIAPPNSSAPVRHLADSGFLRADVPGAALIMDVAPIGPDYLPGHAHADTLSFEFSLFGGRLLTNGGTSRYGLGPEREAERGTASHSTVVIDQANSSEVWSGFRVARRARPFDLVLEHTDSGVSVSCAHDGYRRLPGRPVHRRRWQLEPGHLVVTDVVDGACRSAVARYHVHPDVTVELVAGGSSGMFRWPDGRAARWSVTGGHLTLAESGYAPEFGRRLPRQCLEIAFSAGADVRFELIW